MALAGLPLHGPLPQNPRYHDFADTRTILGIPRFGDVITNGLFVIVGVAGLVRLAKTAPATPDAVGPQDDPAAFASVFVGLALTGIGSAYYHWAPDSARLFWDRLPLTLVFMAVFVILLGERISPGLRRWLLPMLARGAASMLHWRWILSLGPGADDLRLYVLVQFGVMGTIPLLLLVFPGQTGWGRWWWAMIGCYAAAKGFEIADRAVWDATTGFVSGHNLKHVLGATGAACLLPIAAGGRR